MSWKSRKDGRHFQARPAKGSLYGAPVNASLSKEVHARSVDDAREDADRLLRDFRDAKTRDHMREIKRATEEETNRLEVGSRNHNNSVTARRRLERESKIFRSAADKMTLPKKGSMDIKAKEIRERT